MTKSKILFAIILSWIGFMFGSINMIGFATSIMNQYPFVGIVFSLLYFVFLYIYLRLLGEAITLYKNGK